MQTFFQNNNSDELILLFCGWGMDEKPFLPLKSSCDILYVFDYTNTEFNPKIVFSKYKKIFLLTFSAGVFMAGYLKDILPKFDFKVAVNGVFNPFKEQVGIAQDVVSEMKNLTMDTVFDFRKKLIEAPEHIELFNKYQPARSLESSLNELESLQKYAREANIDFAYDKIIISEKDQIIPFKNQQRAWSGHNNISIIEGGHFLFYMFNSLEYFKN